MTNTRDNRNIHPLDILFQTRFSREAQARTADTAGRSKKRSQRRPFNSTATSDKNTVVIEKKSSLKNNTRYQGV